MLRRYDDADLAHVHRINEVNVPAVGAATAERLAQLAAMSELTLVDADVNSEPVGFCVVFGPGADYHSVNYRWFAARYDDFWYLDRIAFAAESRGQGRGAAMYAEVERLSAQLRPSATALTLEVNLRPRNDGSLRFHRRLGFVEVGQQETDYGALVSLMAKPLEPRR